MTTPVELIEAKKRGRSLSEGEIAALVDGVVTGRMSEAQAAAFLMAVWFQGMSQEEVTGLTLAMARSGRMLDLSPLGFCVDKHSTGGVGDKTSLVVGPLVAAAGGTVVKMAGRGLGHTGGTVDKLEAIHGMRVDLSVEEMLDVASRVGLVISGQTEELVPADRVLYAIRDVTATVDSAPLVASSVMSKKLAAGAHGIVIDVKYGVGAFMASAAEARALGELMARIGTDAGRSMAVALSPMDDPLGCAAGNALEVAEAVRCLKNEGPADVTQLCLELSTRMLMLAGVASEADEGRKAAERALASGQALERLVRMVEAQGGDPGCVEEPDRLPAAPWRIPVRAQASGYVHQVDARQVGLACVAAGAGRERRSQAVDPAAGVLLRCRRGEEVRAGDVVAEVHASDRPRAERAASMVSAAFRIGAGRPRATDALVWL